MNLLKRASYKDMVRNWCFLFLSLSVFFFFFNWVAEIGLLACHFQILVTIFMANDFVGFNHMDSKLEKRLSLQCCL